MTVTGLWREPFTVVDGGLSTALETLGEVPAGPLWTAALLVERPDVLVHAHRLAVEAGADVVISASYQASVPGLVAAGLDPARARLALASTSELARRAGAPVVAASVGPYGAVLADGSEYHGRYDASWADVRSFHRARLDVLADSGADLLAIETIPGRVEAQLVVEEALARTSLPMWVTFTCTDDSSTAAGDAIADAVAAVRDDRVVAVGVNCCAPDHVAPLLGAVEDPRPLVAYPNHGGRWDASSECWIEPSPGAVLTDRVEEWLRLGARLVGGCCGVGPDEIRALAERRSALSGRAR